MRRCVFLATPNVFLLQDIVDRLPQGYRDCTSKGRGPGPAREEPRGAAQRSIQMAKIVTTAAFFVALTAPAFATPVAPAPELGASALGFMLASGVAYLLNRRAG